MCQKIFQSHFESQEGWFQRMEELQMLKEKQLFLIRSKLYKKEKGRGLLCPGDCHKSRVIQIQRGIK